MKAELTPLLSHIPHLLASAFFFVIGSVPVFAAEVKRLEQSIQYPDGRPAAEYRLAAIDVGVVLRHGDGPDQCDVLGARDAWVWEHEGTYFMHYDGAGEKGWLACLATSDDLLHWTKRGAVLEFGAAGSADSASASYAVPYLADGNWHLFYMGTPHT